MTQSIAKFYVAGVQFHELKKISDKLEVGSLLQLTAEPTNQYDPNAVRIEFESFMLGYVPRKFSAMVAGYMTVDEITCKIIALDMKRKTYEQLEVELTVED